MSFMEEQKYIPYIYNMLAITATPSFISEQSLFIILAENVFSEELLLNDSFFIRQ